MTAQVIRLPKQERNATTRFKFTPKRLADYPPRRFTYYVYDVTQPGLCMRITPASARTFCYYRKVNGKPERINLGKLNSINLSTARKAAARYEGERAMGKNPAKDRRNDRALGTTVQQLFNLWVIDAKKRDLRSVGSDERMWNLHLENRLGGKQAASVTTSDIERVIHTIGRRHKRTANLCHSLLRRVFNLAIKKGSLKDNPAVSVTRYTDVERDRVLNPIEIKRFLQAAAAEPEPWRSFWPVLLYTGSRRSAVQSMRWQDIDLQAGIWIVPSWASKNKKQMPVALVPQVVEILEDIERIESQWVFPAASDSGHVEYIESSWRRIKSVARLENARIHDLRRTLGSALGAAGNNAFVIAKALGHLSLASAQVYVRVEAESTRAALKDAVGAWHDG